ncbi:FMN-dependent NADH-azoreductase [Thalassoporum mexicanum PCC 7367]|uniref:FMN-dependent NADH-azoreductase n=1 Tax=Thalassoporum mexicanum TaxID=3457544 RepID=UPI00029FABFF|nr:FMN-dependent NADH-azoreductase [Pseudanabaena sp. PCC 7367]AFY70943.1 FMN-dependent NADH-azoreductase [Pseudanabaena sp. PCC 7367]
MTHLLHLDTSPRGDRSVSRQLSKEFVQMWQDQQNDHTITYRDLGHNPVPFVDETWIAASFTPPEARTPEQQAGIEISDRLVDEFLAADCYVFGVPMYNFNVPAVFKAYIDQIVRPFRTFGIDSPTNFYGLVEGKKMLVITARGGDFSPGSPAAPYDLQEPYMRTIFGFIGVTDITFVHAQQLAWGEEASAKAIADAQSKLKSLTASW